ncbi:MAG: hypothetical protein AAF573_02050 [Bacteroidota bacterium]
MKKIQILIFGKHPEILETLIRLVNKNENWLGEGSTDEEKAIELFSQHTYDLVLLGGGISPASEGKVRAIFQKLQPEAKIIQHYGGGSGLLKSEIETALKKTNSSIKMMDNPFE